MIWMVRRTGKLFVILEVFVAESIRTDKGTSLRVA